MLIEDESPLLKVPTGLPVPVVQLLDGVRYALMMADLSYVRLSETMAQAFANGDSQPPPHRLATASFLDAWAMIDSVNRLRNLLPRAYRQKAVPQVKAFLLSTEVIKEIRDSFQHADERIQDAEPFPLSGVPPLWGSLECLAPESEPLRARHARLTPGTRTFTWAGSAIAARSPRRLVDHIALTAFGKEVILTDVHEALAKLARALEAVAPKGPEGCTFSDMLMVGTVVCESAVPDRSSEGGTGDPADQG